jgi:hypothetical protein
MQRYMHFCRKFHPEVEKGSLAEAKISVDARKASEK